MRSRQKGSRWTNTPEEMPQPCFVMLSVATAVCSNNYGTCCVQERDTIMCAELAKPQLSDERWREFDEARRCSNADATLAAAAADVSAPLLLSKTLKVWQ